jgi:transcriptional regulator with XRE-family HTH domain
MIGVTESTIWLWERNRVEPRANFVPGIFDFLGYCLIEPVESWRTRLRRTRVAMGWTQKRLAAEVGLNESTIQGWESGRRKPIIVSQTKVDALFKELAAASRSEKSGL